VNVTAEVSQAEPDPDSHRDSAVGGWPIRRMVASAALVVVAVGYVLPRVLGTTVASVLSSLGNVSVAEIALLAVIWAIGIFVHSFVLTGALPGLSRVRALMLNLTGSAVSNVLPFGGAAATAVNFKMARSWNVSVAAFAAFALIANLWWIVVKLALPLCAVAVLAAAGAMHGPSLGMAAFGSAVGLAAVSGGLALALRNTRAFEWVSYPVSRVGAKLGRPWSPEGVTAALTQARELTRSIIASRWRQLFAGMFGYAVFQALLLGVSLHAVGGGQSWYVVFAAYAIDRVLTLAVFMPGAAGVSELGVAASLVVLGGTAAPAAAGVLLYRAFTFGIEIPIGGVWLAGWLAARWLRTAKAVPAPVAAGTERAT
jgi:putative heme transporter